jgi:hypothetical protein
MANQLIGDQHHVFPGDERIVFAFAVLSHSEVVRQFPDPQRPRRRGQDIEQDLESLAGKAPESPFQDSRRSMKKPLIGSAISTLQMIRDRRVAKALMFARAASNPPIPPPATYRLPTTRSTGSLFSIASICGSNFSSCRMRHP